MPPDDTAYRHPHLFREIRRTIHQIEQSGHYGAPQVGRTGIAADKNLTASVGEASGRNRAGGLKVTRSKSILAVSGGRSPAAFSNSRQRCARRPH